MSQVLCGYSAAPNSIKTSSYILVYQYQYYFQLHLLLYLDLTFINTECLLVTDI